MGVRDMDCQRQSHVRGSILPWRFFKTDVLGNEISSILRLIQLIIMLQVIREYGQTPRNPVDLP